MTMVPLGDSMSGTTSDVAANDECDGWHIEAVLGPEYSEPVRTVDAVIDVVVDRRHTSRLVQDLQRLSPIPSLRHLKRVCPDGRILIQLAADSPRDESSASENNFSKSSKCSPSPQECQKKRSISETVTDSDSGAQDGSMSITDFSSTSKSPSPDEQKKERRALLPRGLDASGLRGRPERCAVPASPPLTRAQFTHAQRLWSCNFHPSRAVEAALAPGAGVHGARRAALLAALRACYRTSAKFAAAAVHPHDGSLVALAVDARDEHPLQHAAMRLVDLVARTQCGGVWTPLPEEKVKESISNACGKDSLPYLCTGLDVVMTHEPCAMCAMALTHARARCVFFSEDNSSCGVLYSHSSPLHTLPGLNHRLQVFHAYLPQEKR